LREFIGELVEQPFAIDLAWDEEPIATPVG